MKCQNMNMKYFDIILLFVGASFFLVLYEVYTYFIHITLLNILGMQLSVTFPHLYYNFALRFSWIS